MGNIIIVSKNTQQFTNNNGEKDVENKVKRGLSGELPTQFQPLIIPVPLRILLACVFGVNIVCLSKWAWIRRSRSF